MRILNLVSIMTLVSATPLMAQNIDFGDNASTWSNDGECDDPRFQGPGMTTTTLLDQDILHDANDCRNAFQAGLLSLRDKSVAVAPADPVFGDDSNEWAHDGECDDRRFAGFGMASGFTNSGIGTDASDCRNGFSEGTITFWDMTAALQATRCDTIAFGDDSGEYPFDGECDDPRFEGLGAASLLSPENFGSDATDCSRLCGFGAIALRDY